MIEQFEDNLVLEKAADRVDSSNLEKNKQSDEVSDDIKKAKEERNKKNRVKRINIYFSTILSVYVGVGVIFANLQGYSISNILTHYWPSCVGVLMIVLGFYFLMRWRVSLPRSYKIVNFVDVDNKYTEMKVGNRSEKDIDLDKLYKTYQEKLASLAEHNSFKEGLQNVGVKNNYDSVQVALNQTIQVLEQKASAADEKASLLLQRGVSYTKFGIGYYLISIALWQAMFWHFGFKKEYLYGIISCSFLFLFIEFLSAWFLKQYKNFTDNSVYLLKIKSIFDRFLIVYSIEGEENDTNGGGVKNYSKSIELLSKDFIWPDVSVIESRENSFAKETISSITELIKAAKQKENNDKGN